jgi:hypothetical protein
MDPKGALPNRKKALGFFKAKKLKSSPASPNVFS